MGSTICCCAVVPSTSGRSAPPLVGSASTNTCRKRSFAKFVKKPAFTGPFTCLELDQPSKELFGEGVGIIDWPFGYQAGTPAAPVNQIRPGPGVGEARWMAFENAFRSVENDIDRDVLVRLQLELGGSAPPPAA